jgi:RNA polymerase sigma-70 factor (ECF subfamily)
MRGRIIFSVVAKDFSEAITIDAMPNLPPEDAMSENSKPPENQDFDLLLQQARLGSESARNELFRLVQKYLGFLAQEHFQSTLSAKAGVSDVVQQTMMHAAQQLDQFQGSSALQFRGWLRQILLNEIRSMQRHFGAKRRDAGQERSWLHGPESDHDLAGELPTPSRELMALEESCRVHEILEKLPEDLRLVIQLRNWERLPFHEIADRMGVTLNRAAKMWYQALVELRRMHEEIDHDKR